ncbi:glycosyl hydrolase family 18 protein [Fictibacillus terranigra]|uniref:Glycosyl hydrolase family 18 protein n=1 Tax=Fictibacillus terranigra TaxID=3058424 RepID=A0ABT8E9D3_9BACL|nr:glycosyl hydrolase family 18 protein [Fictibacillus sp. CENA-BCM004]MDN4074526.1 glycosyl hydrolase family 18 protein [Fictibacillus sp. CENA-BCM004]
MQIHVVQKGDSLYKISQFYNLPWQEIASVNALGPQDVLTVGQTLLIPAPFVYKVKKGDTIEKVASKLGVALFELKQANPGVDDQPLTGGQTLNVPQKRKRTLTVNAFSEPSDRAKENFKKAAKALSYISLFSYEVSENGDLKPLDDAAFLREIKNENVRPLISITTIKDGGFSQELATAVLKNPDTSNKVIENTVRIMKEKGYVGVNVDFEYIGRKNRERYNRFLRNITDRMHKEGYVATSALAPKIKEKQKGVWYEGHDYKAHGQTVDYVILMTYEWGYSGGPPLPVSPLNEVKKVLDYAVNTIPRSKILMGINLYGYDWKLPFVQGGPQAKALSPVQAVQLARKRKTAIQYAKDVQAPYFVYWDKEKKQHKVWFEDYRSMKAKFDLIDEYRLGGASFWNLAFDYPGLWNYLEDRYMIRFQ